MLTSARLGLLRPRGLKGSTRCTSGLQGSDLCSPVQPELVQLLFNRERVEVKRGACAASPRLPAFGSAAQLQESGDVDTRSRCSRTVRETNSVALSSPAPLALRASLQLPLTLKY